MRQDAIGYGCARYSAKSLSQGSAAQASRTAAHLPDRMKAWVDSELAEVCGHPHPKHALVNAKTLLHSLRKRFRCG